MNVGRVGSPHALRGAVTVHPLTDIPRRWDQLREVFLLRDGRRRSLAVQSVRYQGGRVIVRFAEITTREGAAELSGCLLQVPRSAAPPLPPDTYWMADLVGLDVVTVSGQPVGTIREIYRAGNDLLEVVTPEGREMLIPMVRVFVKEVDLAGRTVRLDPIPGLLD